MDFTFAKWPRKNVLEGGGVEEVHDLLLRQRLLHHEAEEDDVAELPEVVEELRAGVRVLNDVLQRGLVVAENTWRQKTVGFGITGQKQWDTRTKQVSGWYISKKAVPRLAYCWYEV